MARGSRRGAAPAAARLLAAGCVLAFVLTACLSAARGQDTGCVLKKKACKQSSTCVWSGGCSVAANACTAVQGKKKKKRCNNTAGCACSKSGKKCGDCVQESSLGDDGPLSFVPWQDHLLMDFTVTPHDAVTQRYSGEIINPGGGQPGKPWIQVLGKQGVLTFLCTSNPPYSSKDPYPKESCCMPAVSQKDDPEGQNNACFNPSGTSYLGASCPSGPFLLESGSQCQYVDQYNEAMSFGVSGTEITSTGLSPNYPDCKLTVNGKTITWPKCGQGQPPMKYSGGFGNVRIKVDFNVASTTPTTGRYDTATLDASIQPSVVNSAWTVTANAPPAVPGDPALAVAQKCTNVFNSELPKCIKGWADADTWKLHSLYDDNGGQYCTWALGYPHTKPSDVVIGDCKDCSGLTFAKSGGPAVTGPLMDCTGATVKDSKGADVDAGKLKISQKQSCVNPTGPPCSTPKGPTPASVSETCTGCSPRIDDHVLAGGKPITFSLDTGFQTHNVNYAPNAGSSCSSSCGTSQCSYSFKSEDNLPDRIVFDAADTNCGSCSSAFTSGVPCSECRSMPSAYGKGFYVPLDDAGSSIVMSTPC